MKKVLFTVALLLGACFASAQVSAVKEAKSLKSKPEEAAKVIEPALTTRQIKFHVFVIIHSFLEVTC